MLRKFSLAMPILAVLGGTVSAQTWAEKMFAKRTHDFGTVAAGADVEHRFEVTNLYKETMRIAGVRSSCGCTTPTIENDTLEAHEKGYVVAKFNTRSFRGHRGATVTVTIEGVEKPFRAEVRLRVDGNIRGDVQFRPGSAKFQKVDQGTVHERTVAVTYAGRPDWQVVDVRSDSERFEVEMTETTRGGGLVSYDFLIRLKQDAPAGYFSDQLVLVTNDSRNQRIPLDVEGNIVAEISVKPQRLVLGEVRSGQQISKNLVVTGKKPFKIMAVECEDGCFSFKPTSDAAKKVHVVRVTFNADNPGKVQRGIHITTDRGDNIGADLTAYANVLAGEENTTPESDEDPAETEEQESDRQDAAEQESTDGTPSSS